MWETEFNQPLDEQETSVQKAKESVENDDKNQTKMSGNRMNDDKNDDTIGSVNNWYNGAKDYWNSKPATIEGVLEGYGKYHEMETDYSKKVLQDHMHLIPSKGRALEGGAGIGRISKQILNPLKFESIDIQDCSEQQINQAKTNVPFVKK